jgi:carbonic anhydrase
VAARATGAAPAPLPPRPAGAGRYVVAVVTCADAAIDVPALLGLRSEDVLLISNAGATADGDAIELLERAVARERLSLCIVLTHADCASLSRAPAGDERGSARGAAAREFAARRRLPLDKAQALLQRELLLGASTLLADATRSGNLNVVAASADAATGALAWHLGRSESLPMAPVR